MDLVQAELDDFLSARRAQLAEVSPDLAPFVDFSEGLLRGGKRFRALFCYWGWRAVTATPDTFDPLPDDDADDDLPAIARVSAALEIFHAAALVHDDIMDNSDTRRGRPSAHRRFERLHSEQGFTGNALGWGQSAALLLGDLLLGWSDELLDSGLRLLGNAKASVAVRDEFTTMRTLVTVGQYLDILEEKSWRTRDERELLPRAHRVIVYKSAKYSIEAPLALGAAAGGADADQLESLRAFGLPLGVAFQLRDDLLGVFGDPEVTGKPAGDDLREGKRTVLIALARAAMPGTLRSVLDELLGDPDLDAQQVGMLQSALREAGAVDQVERIIDHNVGLALKALGSARISASAREELSRLAETTARRTA